MKFLKHKAYTYLIFLIIVALTILVYTLFLFNGKINTTTESINTTTFIIGLVLFLILGIISGCIEKQRGLLSGIESAIILVIIFVLFRVFGDDQFKFLTILKYVFYILLAGIGGIIGVNLPFSRKKINKIK